MHALPLEHQVPQTTVQIVTSNKGHFELVKLENLVHESLLTAQ